jgi:hypothetical protein
LSSSWRSIFKTGNDTDCHSLELARKFHCADCLKQYQQLSTHPNHNDMQQQQHSPQPPLMPITPDAMRGLHHYFGQPANPLPPLTTAPAALFKSTAPPAICMQPPPGQRDQLVDSTRVLESEPGAWSSIPSETSMDPVQHTDASISQAHDYFDANSSIQEKRQCM